MWNDRRPPPGSCDSRPRPPPNSLSCIMIQAHREARARRRRLNITSLLLSQESPYAREWDRGESIEFEPLPCLTSKIGLDQPPYGEPPEGFGWVLEDPEDKGNADDEKEDDKKDDDKTNDKTDDKDDDKDADKTDNNDNDKADDKNDGKAGEKSHSQV
ncbi:hypothetical protein ACHAQA_009033 [Verticillium albo-atrum]